MKTLVAVAVGLMLCATAGAADADPIVVWEFNLPSNSVASQTPPYPTVATLTLTQSGQDSCALGFSWTLDCERVLAGGVSR